VGKPGSQKREGDSMAMKINLMENRIGKYGRDEEIDSSDYNPEGAKGKKPYKGAIGTLLFFGLTSLAPACYADTAPKEVTTVQAPAPQNTGTQVAQKPAKASVPQKKTRILVKEFDTGGKQAEETKYIGRSVKTTYSDNDEGAIIRDAIERELITRQRSGKFNTSGMYAIVVDTDMPDSQEADDVVRGRGRREGGMYKFDVQVVNAKTGALLYAYNLELRDKPGVESLGGELIAVALDDYFSEQE
jgi:hypothetical protein